MSNALPLLRGATTRLAPRIVVLGGPVYLCGANWYTCMAVEEGILDLSPRGSRMTKTTPGLSFTIPEVWLADRLAPLRWTEIAIKHAQMSFAKGANLELAGIPVQDCPQCEIEEMIFYEGDYICAWCREMLETE